MTLGAEFRDLVAELLTEPDGFGSTLRWRHITRVEDVSTGAVTETPSDETITAALVDPIRTRLFTDSTLQQSSTAVLVPAGQLATDPKQFDQVEVSSGRFLRVVELKELRGPGETGSPVLIAWVAALGA